MPDQHYYHHDVSPVRSVVGDLCVKWDSYWYLNIVERGYEEIPGEESNTAFLPSYPFIIKCLTVTGLSPAMAGVVISTACFILLLILAFMFAEQTYGEGNGRYLVLFLCLFPSSWVFHMVYTESMFCAALFGFLVFYLRGNHWVAASVGWLLPMTRGVGLAMLPAVVGDILLTWRREKQFPKAKLISLGSVIAGTIAVSGAYWHITGHPFGFLQKTAEWSTQAGNKNYLIPLIGSLLDNLDDKEAQAYIPFLVIYTVATVVLLIKRRDVTSFFSAAYMAMLFASAHWSHLRYLLPLLPLHALITCFLVKRNWIPYVFPILAIMQLLITRLYLDWRFVI